MTMTKQDATELRRALGSLVLDLQVQYAGQGYNPVDVVPELIGSLLSLAWFISSENCGISREAFILMCDTIAVDPANPQEMH